MPYKACQASLGLTFKALDSFQGPESFLAPYMDCPFMQQSSSLCNSAGLATAPVRAKCAGAAPERPAMSSLTSYIVHLVLFDQGP